MKRGEVRKTIHEWGIDRLKRMNHSESDGNIAWTEIRISALLAREAGLDLSVATFEPNQELRVRQWWNFKERTPRKYFVYFVDGDQTEPFLSGDGEFLDK